MEGLYLFIILLVGMSAGAGAVWLLLQARTMTAYDRAKAEADAEHAELSERLRGKDEQLQAIKGALEQSTTAFGELRLDLEAGAEKRALAEAQRREILVQMEAKDEQILSLKASIEQSTATFEQLRQELEALGQRLPQAGSFSASPEPAASTEFLDAVARSVEEKITRLQQQIEHMEEVRTQSTNAADSLRELGATVYERVEMLGQNIGDLRHALTHALDLCNLLAGSLETRVAGPVREIKEFGKNGHSPRPVEIDDPLELLRRES